MKEEIKKILKMVEEGKITAEEGYRLIDALMPQNTSAKKRFLKIYVESEEGDVVNIKVPFSLIKFGIRFIPKDKYEIIKSQNIDLEEILSSLSDDFEGELVDIKSEDGDIVKIWVE